MSVFLSTITTASELSAMQDACDRKMPTACYEFGLLYERGIGVQQDSQKAKEYFEKACDYGYDKACEAYEKSLRNKK